MDKSTSAWRQRESERVAHVYLGAIYVGPGFRMRLCDGNLLVGGVLTQPRTERRCKRCEARTARMVADGDMTAPSEGTR